MYQEYHDWEKSYKNKATNGKARIDTEKLWANLQSHIPASEHKRNWLPISIFLLFALLGAIGWLWLDNAKLKNQNAQLYNQLTRAEENLMACNRHLPISNDAHAVNTEKLAIRGKTISSKHRSRKASPAGEENMNFQSEDKLIVASVEKENTPIVNRELVPFAKLDRLVPKLTMQNHKVLTRPFQKNSAPIYNKPAFFVEALTFYGSSSLNGKYGTAEVQWNNHLDYNGGIQIKFGKYLGPNWYAAASFQYMAGSNRSDLTVTSALRTEITGTTQILIDGNGNITSIQGTTGATTFHKINARLYNFHEQFYTGPSLGYTYYHKQRPLISIFSSAQWLIASQSSGKTPIGEVNLSEDKLPQWLYKQKTPLLTLGLVSSTNIGRHWKLNLGAQVSYLSDKFYHADQSISRNGFFWNVLLGFQKNL